MKRTLTKKQSRLLALGILLLLLIVCGLILYVPARMLHVRYDKAQEAQMDLLVRYQRIGATKPEIQAALDSVKKLEGRKHFLKNVGAALAASEIQEIAKGLIETNGGRLNSMQVVPQKDDAGYRKVTVNIQLVCNMTTLRKIIYAVETIQPYLLVDNISIRTQPGGRFGPAPGVEPDVVSQFDLSGFALLADRK